MKDQYYLDALKTSYYNTLMKKIEESENSSKEDAKIDQAFLNIWAKKLESKVDQCVLEFSNDLRSTYMMTDMEFQKTFQDAGMEYIDSVISDLVDKNMLITKINEEGDFQYELTQTGLSIIE